MSPGMSRIVVPALALTLRPLPSGIVVAMVVATFCCKLLLLLLQAFAVGFGAFGAALLAASARSCNNANCS